MYMNGVRTGMALTVADRSPILKVRPVGLSVCAAGAVGAATRGIAVCRTVAATPLRVASATLVFA